MFSFFINKPPIPPANPTHAVPGYNIPGYMRLLASIPTLERQQFLQDLESDNVKKRADELAVKFQSDARVTVIGDSRTQFLAALKCLQQGKISVEQLATLHLWESAIRLYYTGDAFSMLCFEYVQEGTSTKRVYQCDVPGEKHRPTQVTYAGFTSTNRSIYETLSPALSNVDVPLVKRYFNFTDLEYEEFCNIMIKAPTSEQEFLLIIVPKVGCLSELIENLNDVVSCMQSMTLWTTSNEGKAVSVKYTLAPSFTMEQAALDVKAKSLGNSSVKLVPTYYMLDRNDYARLKITGQIAVGLYMPGKANAYSRKDVRYMQNVDGHESELPYAAIKHDIYHAYRELCMEKKVAEARWRLDVVLRDKDIETRIIDGELISSYPLQRDTIRVPDSRANKPQIFGDMLASLNLTDDQKKLCIEDMIIHRQAWHKNFSIGYRDLTLSDQTIYHELAKKHYPENDVNEDAILLNIEDLSLVRRHIEVLNYAVNDIHYYYNSRLIDRAIQKGCLEVIEYLMSKNARLFDNNNENNTNALYWLSAYLRNPDHDPAVASKIVDLFLITIPHFPFSGLTPSHVNALRGQLPDEKDQDQADVFGLLPIHYAIMSGTITTEWLRQKKYDVLTEVKHGIFQGVSILSLLIFYHRWEVLMEFSNIPVAAHSDTSTGFEILNTNMFTLSISRNFYGRVANHGNNIINTPDQKVLEYLYLQKQYDILKQLLRDCSLREILSLKPHKYINDDEVLTSIMSHDTLQARTVSGRFGC